MHVNANKSFTLLYTYVSRYKQERSQPDFCQSVKRQVCDPFC